MKHAIILTLLILAGRASWAASDPAGQQLFLAAERQINLFQKDVSPFQLDMDFVLQIQEPTSGHLTLRRAAENRWWRKVTLADFEMTEIRDGEEQYTVRNYPYIPVRVDELFNTMYFPSAPEQMEVKKPKQRTEGGLQMTCMQTRDDAKKKTTYEVCLDAVSHDLLSSQWGEPPDEKRRKEYREHAEFQGHRYPRQMLLFINGSRVPHFSRPLREVGLPHRCLRPYAGGPHKPAFGLRGKSTVECIPAPRRICGAVTCKKASLLNPGHGLKLYPA